jgi:hypothetical protein
VSRGLGDVYKRQTNNNNKIFINGDDNPNINENIIITNILEFDSVFTIKKVFVQLEISEIKSILKKYLQLENIDLDKKSRIKFILKKYKISNEEDYYDKEFDAEKVKKKIFSNTANNINNQKNNLYLKINTIQNGINNIGNPIINYANQDIILVLNEIINQIKYLKTDINNLNTKIDLVCKNINQNNSLTNTYNVHKLKKNKEKPKDKFENKFEESEEDLENELNKYI